MAIPKADIEKKGGAPRSSGEGRGSWDKVSALLYKEVSFGSGEWADKKKEAFLSELGILLRAGLDLRRVLEMLLEERKDDKTGEVVREVHDRVVRGESLSAAMEATGRFGVYECRTVAIGEETGHLPWTVEELASFFKWKRDLRRQLKSVLTYPIIVLIATVGVMIFMTQVMLPMFGNIYERFGAELPTLTQKVIAFSEWTASYFPLIMVIMLSMVGFLYWRRKDHWFRKWASKALGWTPVIGPMVRALHLARFNRTMHLLTISELPLMRSIELMERMTTYWPIASSLAPIKEAIVRGEPLYKALSRYSIYPSRMVSLIKVGEEVNRLSEMFGKVSEQYRQDLEHRTAMLGGLMEPILILLIGVLVGVIVIAMYLPIFQLSTTVGA